MTTIPEVNDMDEFFNFEDAANPLDTQHGDFSSLPSGPYDISLAFAQPENDENSFTCLQHFTSPPAVDNAFNTDTTQMGADDFTDFPRWIDGMVLPTKSCAYCRRMRIHCKVIKEGLRKGSCTSCVALVRSCSLTMDTRQSPTTNEPAACRENFCIPSDIIDDMGGLDGLGGSPIPASCDECRLQGLVCELVKEGDSQQGCTNCVGALGGPCSFTYNNDIANWQTQGTNPAWTPSKSPVEENFLQSTSSSHMASRTSSTENVMALGENNSKIGARFSRESIRILRGWLSTHHSHPYPGDEEKETLMRQTGLNKTQITNWLANARRRGKVRPPRSKSPGMNNYANAMDIPRRSTPALENMNPLERWQHSPPENEPASVTAIAKAVKSSAFSSGLDSPYTNYGHTDDGSSRSLCNVSSTSSLGTSHSSHGSFASAFSHKSQGSFGSFGNRGRRRRRRAPPKPAKANQMGTAPKTYQCTFCTETFKTKHDWQRHEKSLHLSLERWICCPNGPNQFCSHLEHNACVFCAMPNPTPDHAEVHNYTSCAERSLEERTFYRKDHLRQHLSLVHDVKFQNWAMDAWQVTTPEIRSRCGFCGIVLDTWGIRVDHIAEHFKGGKSMADWKGDWGFEPQVLDIVENGMPPYLIHDERNSMDPFEATKERDSATEKRTLEDFVKIGLVEYVHDTVIRGGMPTDDDLLIQARRILKNSDELACENSTPEISWFRDLILLSGTTKDDEETNSSLPWEKRLEMIAAQAPHTTIDLTTISCSKQRALAAFMKAKQALGLTPTDRELQAECCRILDDVEASSNFRCKPAVAWFKYLITSSSCWLREFRRRTGLPRSSEMALEHIRSADDKSIDYSIHNKARLEYELKDWTRFQISLGIRPSDSDIQRQARLLVYKNDDPWNQTAVDDPAILHLFKRQTGLLPTDEGDANSLDMPTLNEVSESSSPSPKTLHWDLDGLPSPSPKSGSSPHSNQASSPDLQQLSTQIMNQPSTNTNPTLPLHFFLNDATCYGRLVRELTRFVTATLSPLNINSHVPTDFEIQNHARMVIYSDPDPWNQTAADNAEWLLRFKRDVGLAPASEGPGLPTGALSWRVAQGGSGFSPPYICPKPELTVPTGADEEEGVTVNIKGRTYSVSSKTASHFARGLGQRWTKPGRVFCSRELEMGLQAFVLSELGRGQWVSDEMLRAKSREILAVPSGMETAADDQNLLEKFKMMVGLVQADSGTGAGACEIGEVSSAGMRMDFDSELQTFDDSFLKEFDQELDTMDLTGLAEDIAVEGMEGLDGINLGPNNLAPLSSFETGKWTAGGTSGVRPESTAEGKFVCAQDYADHHRVHATTASPLQRRASMRVAEKSGFSFPSSVGGAAFNEDASTF